jgi:hypothetical protein
MEYFGTLSPSLEERTVLFNRLWNEYGNQYELNMNGFGLSISEINRIRETCGPFNVIRRGRCLRFKNAADLTYVTLKYAKKHDTPD